MFDYSNSSNRFIKKNSKLFNNIFKQNYRNNFLLDNLISDLYEGLLNLVPERIAAAASINSRDSFEYFSYYSVEDIRLILNNINDNWSICYQVNPSYLDTKKKLNQNTNTVNANVIVINLKEFYEKHVKKYYH